MLTSARAEKLIYHDIKTDASGKIVPWYGSGPSQAYDHDIRLLFDFWKTMRKCPNGVPGRIWSQLAEFCVFSTSVSRTLSSNAFS